MSRIVVIIALYFLVTNVLGTNDLTTEQLLKNIEVSQEADKSALMNQLSRMYLGNDLDKAAEWAQKAGLLAAKLNQTDQLALAKKHLGVVAFYHLQFDEAEHNYREALKLFEKDGNRLEISNIYNNLALIQYELSNFKQTLKWHHKALEIREQLDETSLIIASLSNLGNTHQASGNTNEAYAHYSKAIDINRMVQPENLNIGLLSNMASIQSERGNQVQAKILYEEAISNANRQNDIRQQINLFNNLGNLYFKLGDYENAIDVFNKAIDLSKKYPVGGLEGSLLLNVGNIYWQTGQINKALYLYQQALNSENSAKDQRFVIHAMINIGLMYEKLDQIDSARHYFEQSVAQSKKLDDQKTLTMSYNAYGNFLMKSADFDKAESYLSDALKLAAANQLMNETAKASMNLGSVAFEQGRLSDARSFYMQSLVLNKQQNYLFQQMENLQGLSRVEEKDNNPAKALEYYKEYVLLNDSLFNIQKQEQITAIEGKLNLQLKEEELQNQALLIDQQNNVLRLGRERMIYLAVVGLLLIIIIVILFSRNRLKQSKEKALLEQKQLETEYRLLRSQMNPHFLFNALNSIQAFISENNTMQAELYLSKFARLMRYYLESSSKSTITLMEEVEGLKLNIELERLRMNNAFDFKVDVDENIFIQEIEVAPMLAQPFVENAIKHGLRTKKENGFLELSYSLVKNYIRCRIKDNGIGRIASGLKKTNGTHNSKGIELTRKRLMYLHGKSYKDEMLQVTDLFNENGEPAGTQIDFIFPYN